MREQKKENLLNKTEDHHKFLVNKNGFPLSEDTTEALWKNIREKYEDGEKYEAEVRRNPDLEKITVPSLPCILPSMSIQDKLQNVQTYLNQLQYNHTGMQFFEVRKYRPISGLMEIAREMIKYSLPIKCLEAVILSLFLTSGIPDLLRFAISFKSKFSTNVHRHVVLGLNHGSQYGAVGMSRRKELMDKPLHFQSLSDLILEYKRAYENCHHVLKKVKLSLPVIHDVHSCERINWSYLKLSFSQMKEEDIKMILTKYCRVVKAM